MTNTHPSCCSQFRKIMTFSFVLIVLIVGVASAQNPLRFNITEKTLSIKSGDQLLLNYQYQQVPFKPCLSELFTPKGINILRNAPHDHLHHHALMYAISVNGVNFWEEHKAPGRQKHRSLSDLTITKANKLPQAGFTEKIDWLNPGNNELLLQEKRTIQIQTVKDQAVTLLSWNGLFECPPDKNSVRLTGSHYHGLGMRFIVAMDKGGKILNADDKEGKVYRGSERLLRSTWCAYTAMANGKPVTVAMFDHPQNPRHPTTWFTMTAPFAYLSATLNLHEQPLPLTKEAPLRLRYGVALWDGTIDKQQINQLYKKWITLPPVKPPQPPKENKKAE